VPAVIQEEVAPELEAVPGPEVEEVVEEVVETEEEVVVEVEGIRPHPLR